LDSQPAISPVFLLNDWQDRGRTIYRLLQESVASLCFTFSTIFILFWSEFSPE